MQADCRLGPFTTEVSEILRLRNPHNDPVAFKVTWPRVYIHTHNAKRPKVKTTAPKQYARTLGSEQFYLLTVLRRYCVRPNSGRIEPGQYVEVSGMFMYCFDRYMLTSHAVLLQAMKEDPPMDAKCRDKFLVQSVAVSADQELPNVTAIVRSSFIS